MTRRSLLLVATAALFLPAAPAAAESADWLCPSDTSRGGVPLTFVVEACVDGSGMTLRNSLDVPVVITGGGVGPAITIHSAGDETETLVRSVHETRAVLAPGDVVRWPIGRGAASLTVSDLEPATAPSIVATLDPFLPREGPREVPDAVLQAFADVVEPIADAVAARGACADGQNFLGVAACDVTTATGIAQALDDEFSRGVAAEVAPAVLDRMLWREWADVEEPTVASMTGGTATLRQLAVRTPAPAVAPAPAPSTGNRSSTPAPPAPAPAPAAPAPVAFATGNPPRNGRGNGNGHGRWNAWLSEVQKWLRENADE